VGLTFNLTLELPEEYRQLKEEKGNTEKGEGTTRVSYNFLKLSSIAIWLIVGPKIRQVNSKFSRQTFYL